MVTSRVWAFTECVRSTIAQGALTLGLLSVVMNAGLPARAQEEGEPSSVMGQPSVGDHSQVGNDQRPRTNDSILQRSKLAQPAKTVKEWVAQIEAATVQVTEVKLERTDTGLDIVLETAEGKPLQVDATKFRTEGNSLIADIPNAVLVLPEGQAFTADNPTEEIATVQVVQQDVSSIRVVVTGTNAVPQQEVTLRTGALAYSLNPEGDEPDEEIVVTGEGQEGYRVPNASTATRTDTPIRDIPASIQVVPQQVLRDRNVRAVREATETVSGVIESESGTFRTIRGFEQPGSFRNGFRDDIGYSEPAIGTIEQIEVLKGPASVLFGAIEPGGIINVVTKKPLSEPYYKLGFDVGNYEFYQPSIDLSGPLDENNNILYRLIAVYQNRGSFVDQINIERITIAPSLTFKLGERTSLDLYYEYYRDNRDPFTFVTFALSDGSFLPRSFYPGYPLSFSDRTAERYGYEFKHEFSDNWQIRNNLAVIDVYNRQLDINGATLEDDRFLTGFGAFDYEYTPRNVQALVDVIGKFDTGSISHQLLIGFDFNYLEDDFQGSFSFDLPPLDIRNPNYNIPRPALDTPFAADPRILSYGLYFQDQIALSDSWKLLIGGRYDWVSFKGDSEQNDGAFSPRIGLVYQPSETVSLYASYSQSFRQSTGVNLDGTAFKPTRGTQYEIGVKADLLENKLLATLAAYRITKTNVTTPDPIFPLFSVQTGEQRSQGIELDVTGKILPGWNVIISYAYTDAEVTEDNVIPVGNRLRNVPYNQVSLWTTYEIQEGDLSGLGFGFGLFYVGERQADLENTFTVKDYLRSDAAVYYRRNGFRIALNIRNLFDIDYAESGNNRNSIYRGDPFTITGSLSWEF